MAKKIKKTAKISYKELLDKYNLFSSLMDSIPDVIYFKDITGRLILVNKAHARGLGLEPKKVIGKTDFDIFPKERAKKMREDDLRVIKTGKPIIDKVERATRADGIDNYVSTTKIPRYDSKGKVIGLVGITRDITRRMQIQTLEEEKLELEKKVSALEELNKIKSEFISIASHELRTPLAITKEAVMLILDKLAGEINEKQESLLVKARENIERLRRMLEDLLDMSRIESGRLKLRYSLVNLNDLLKENSDFFIKQAQAKGVGLEYSLPEDEVNIFIDTERINQVIINLINNAIKFTEEGGKVTVELKILENRIRVGVIDTGVGISKSDLSKIFLRFVQVNKIPGFERKGLGLGLSIVKELIEKHGGEVWAESKLGVGSKFYFTLPRFYTTSVLEKSVKDRINHLLDSGVPVHLVNLFIVNYKKFKERINIASDKLFGDLRQIIALELAKISWVNNEGPEVIMNEAEKAEFSVVIPNADSAQVAELCVSLRDNINGYFRDNKVEGVFVTVGILSYPDSAHLKKPKEYSASICINKIFIGAEMRRYERFDCKAGLDIILSKNKTETTQVIDISQGGICFVSSSALQTDKILGIKFDFPGVDGVMSLKGRVAWIRETEAGSGLYKVGLEFIDLSDKDKKTLAQVLKNYSARKR